MRENDGEVEDELIAWIGGACEADGVAEDEVGRGIGGRCGRTERDQVAAKRLAWDDEGRDRREREKGRWLGGIGLVTRLHDGVLRNLVYDFRAFARPK